MSDQLEQISLTSGERVDWPFLLSYAYNTLFIAFRKDDMKENEPHLIVEYIENVIPKPFRDDIYEKELTENTEYVDEDIRPSFAGRRLDISICEELGIPAFKKIQKIDPFNKLGAISNLLFRMGLFGKKRYVERATGRRYVDANET